jgi:acetylornithine deacetylase
MTLVHDQRAIAQGATEFLARLVAFDTTSRGSNLALIEWVEGQLASLGVGSRRVPNAAGDKANLFATLGPAVAGGVILSGHTDVVPVDGQRWTSDPWTLTRRGQRLHGRGTCDMKAFLALALAAAPAFARGSRPVHLAFSYDEEVGCLGAPAMIDRLTSELPPVAAAIVGEPTNMEVTSGHKGIVTHVVTVTGHEAHSALTHLGLSANMAAIRLLGLLEAIAVRLEHSAEPDSPFCPRHATLTVGQIAGGTAVNILARECVFAFDLRCPPGLDPRVVLAPFLAAAAQLDSEMKARFPGAGVHVRQRSSTPAFAPRLGNRAEALARRLAADAGPLRVVPYAAEAGQFQEAGFATVLCGPGSIAQAHQPDEYIEIEQLDRGAGFMAALAADLAG